MRTRTADVRHRINILGTVILLSFLAVALALVYWSIARGPGLLARDDNPRLVEAELRIVRGRILDANNEVLAETVGPADDLRRVYSPAAGPAVGYYSIRHGTTGVEQGLDALLRGESDNPWATVLDQELMHRTQVGNDIRLTLDSRWQRTAESLLGDNDGGILLLALPDVSVRAMASQPGYDPNTLDENFDELAADVRAPLLNRVSQGQYQPGLVLQPFLLAAALERGLIEMDGQVDGGASGVVVINGSEIACAADPPEGAIWADVLQNACPEAMLGLGEDLAAAGLLEVFEGFGLLRPPALPIATEATDERKIADPSMAAIGQDLLPISPLQAGLALAALANEGEFTEARLISGVADGEGVWQAQPNESETTKAVSAEAAGAILNSLPVRDGIKEHAALVLSGPEGSTNAWYLGLAPATKPRFAVVVVVEGSDDLLPAQRAGRALLKAAIG